MFLHSAQIFDFSPSKTPVCVLQKKGKRVQKTTDFPVYDNIIKTRAKARNVTTNKYMKGNLLTKEVTAKDVALAFLHLAISEKTTGAVLTVDGGNIAASMR